MEARMSNSEQRSRVRRGMKHGGPLRLALEARREELDFALARLRNSTMQNSAPVEAIESALAALEALLPDTLEEIPPVLASQLTHWLEVSRHLGILDAEPARAQP